MAPGTRQDICAPPTDRSRGYLVFEAELYCQFPGPGFFRHPGVRAALNDEPVAMNGLDDAPSRSEASKRVNSSPSQASW